MVYEFHNKIFWYVELKKVWIHDNDLFWYKVTLTFMIIWYVPYKSFKLILCNIRENLLTLIGRQTLIKIYIIIWNVIWIYILNKISKLIKRGNWGFFLLKFCFWKIKKNTAWHTKVQQRSGVNRLDKASRFSAN